MPHLRFRGMKKEEVLEISSQLLDKLSLVIDCPKDHFTLEYIPSLYIFDGKESAENSPFVEMFWFNRSEEVKTTVANIITDMLSKYGYSYIAIYFTDLKKENYFENGQHF